MNNSAVAAKVAASLLRYPDAEALAAMPAVRAVAAELPAALADPLGLVIVHRAATHPTILATEYVELFDLRRHCSLHLSHYTAGDTRNRGEALVRFSAVYRAAGLRLDGGELPDFLPAVLELASYAGDPGWALLREHRIGLDLLAHALEKEKSVYRYAVHAVQRLLPPRPVDLAATAALARSGPPPEQAPRPAGSS